MQQNRCHGNLTCELSSVGEGSIWGSSSLIWLMVLAFWCAFWLPEPVEAREPPKAAFYRYTMSDGRTEVGRQVPAEAINSGYEVLDKKMRVIRKVRPALTSEERAEKEFIAKKQEEDSILLQTFATSEDAERARDRKIAALDVIVNISKGNILRLNLEYETLAGVAATKLRKGQAVPDHVKDNMGSIDRQIQEAKTHIEAKEREKQAIFESYQPDIDRLKELEK